MNILFLTMVNIDNLNERGIYQDLVNELIRRGNKLFIASPSERRQGQETHIVKGDNYEILKVKTLNLQKTNVVEKGIGQLLMESQFEKAIKKYWGDVRFDLVLYSTPPITFNKVIESIKKRDGAKSYLMLKDIFPQNAIDLGMMKENGFFHKMFQKKEEKLYKISDKIGTMSPANSEFLLKNNPEVEATKVELCPNAVKVLAYQKPSIEEKSSLLKKLEIPENKTIFIYGGNLGKPQGIEFLIEVLKAHEASDNSFIIIVGNGTEYHKIEKWFEENNPENAKLLSALPKEEYDKLVRIADVGLIFLDHRFSIPNYPSRLLSYLENCQPVICATDINTDIGKIAQQEGYGFWCESIDVSAFMELVNRLASNSELINKMGKKGREFLEKEYSVEITAQKILSFASNNL